MDLTALSGWALPGAFSPLLLLIAYLIRDNTRLRRERKEVDTARTDDKTTETTRKATLHAQIDGERQRRFDAEERAVKSEARAVKAEARSAGLEERIKHLEDEVKRLRLLIEAGHA